MQKIRVESILEKITPHKQQLNALSMLLPWEGVTSHNPGLGFQLCLSGRSNTIFYRPYVCQKEASLCGKEALALLHTVEMEGTMRGYLRPSAVLLRNGWKDI
jgi:hypothetical protein